MTKMAFVLKVLSIIWVVIYLPAMPHVTGVLSIYAVLPVLLPLTIYLRRFSSSSLNCFWAICRSDKSLTRWSAWNGRWLRQAIPEAIHSCEVWLFLTPYLNGSTMLCGWNLQLQLLDISFNKDMYSFMWCIFTKFWPVALLGLHSEKLSFCLECTLQNPGIIRLYECWVRWRHEFRAWKCSHLRTETTFVYGKTCFNELAFFLQILLSTADSPQNMEMHAIAKLLPYTKGIYA